MMNKAPPIRSAVLLGLIGSSALGLAGCTATANAPAAPPPAERELCNAAPAQSLLGQTATQQLGQQIAQLTGARSFRWAAPNSALTMDYRADRVTVSYDDAMKVTRIDCG